MSVARRKTRVYNCIIFTKWDFVLIEYLCTTRQALVNIKNKLFLCWWITFHLPNFNIFLVSTAAAAAPAPRRLLLKIIMLFIHHQKNWPLSTKVSYCSLRAEKLVIRDCIENSPRTNIAQFERPPMTETSHRRNIWEICEALSKPSEEKCQRMMDR